jgi:hypothetical protein
MMWITMAAFNKEANNETSNILNNYFCFGYIICRMFHALFLSGRQELGAM